MNILKVSFNKILKRFPSDNYDGAEWQWQWQADGHGKLDKSERVRTIEEKCALHVPVLQQNSHTLSNCTLDFFARVDGEPSKSREHFDVQSLFKFLVNKVLPLQGSNIPQLRLTISSSEDKDIDFGDKLIPSLLDNPLMMNTDEVIFTIYANERCTIPIQSIINWIHHKRSRQSKRKELEIVVNTWGLVSTFMSFFKALESLQKNLMTVRFFIKQMLAFQPSNSGIYQLDMSFSL